MHPKICSTVVIVISALVLATAADAQIATPYTENFDAGALPAGWTVTTLAGAGAVTWGVDATPAAVGATPSTFGGSASSLNYNDGTDTVDPAAAPVRQAGRVDSPLLDVVPLAGSVVVSFQCNYNVEITGGGGSFFDTRTMSVVNSGGTVLGTFRFDVAGTDSNPPGTTCPAPVPDFHGHTLDVSAVVGATSPIRIRYTFDSDPSSFFGPAGTAGFEGWFIENLRVTCLDTIVPSTPVNLLPVDGDCRVVPPAVTLDWSDSTDVTPCEPGTILNYFVEVDNDPLFGSPDFTSSPVASTVTTSLLLPGTYSWRVTAFDQQGNASLPSTVTTFLVESALAPLAPDTLFVNESSQGAQTGDSGFVDPVVDLTPAFSAIFRDLNTCDSASALRFQVSDDALFATVAFDSGTVVLVPQVALAARCPDQTMPIELSRDTVYFWRIQFTDSNGATGPFSAAQSFHTGDDFDFGVRRGSSNHSRKCFVATAAWGGVSPEVSSLMSFRSGVIESSSAGRTFSRFYTAAGPSFASIAGSSAAGRSTVRAGLTPLASAAARPELAAFGALALLILLGAAALRRL